MEKIGDMSVTPHPAWGTAYVLVKASPWDLLGMGIVLGIGIALGMTFFLSLAKLFGWITA